MMRLVFQQRTMAAPSTATYGALVDDKKSRSTLYGSAVVMSAKYSALGLS